MGLVACHERAETIDGVRIVPIERGSGRLDRMLRVGWRVYAAARRERGDVYHFHDPELMWVGALLKLGGARVIYDVHEDVPKQIMGKHWIPPWARPLVSKAYAMVEQAGARIVDGIVAATPSMTSAQSWQATSPTSWPRRARLLHCLWKIRGSRIG